MMANLSTSQEVTLKDLLPDMDLSTSPVISGLDNDSRTIQGGDLFLAYPGSQQDGRHYIDEAIAQGAVAVCYESGGAECAKQVDDKAVLIPVENLANKVGLISSRYFQQPTMQMTCIGVTGTNGKTTCAYWLTQLLQKLGGVAGLVGTIGAGVWKEGKTVSLAETCHTTPDAVRLQHLLYEFKQQAVTHAVMEISSHGLDQGRVQGIHFNTALFTNLSRDHLDYHGSMEAYGKAKAKLFEQPGLQQAVINIDDVFGARLATTALEANNQLTVMSYSISGSAADVYLSDLKMMAGGISATIHSPWGSKNFTAPVVGEFNVSNLLGVIAVLCAEGFVLDAVLTAVQAVQAPPGRLQSVTTDAGVTVYVDYAHTPDALENVLVALSKQHDKKLWCVFGCGGDRDQGKRPLMGQVAVTHADHCVVTSDNPRYENPADIIEQVVSAVAMECITVIEDRAEAISYAVAQAQPGDVILVAGKGHETYQEVQGEKLIFDDVLQVQQALQERMRSCEGGLQ